MLLVMLNSKLHHHLMNAEKQILILKYDLFSNIKELKFVFQHSSFGGGVLKITSH